MKRFVLALAAAATALAAAPASAQYPPQFGGYGPWQFGPGTNMNKIVNSGNGVGNTIVARNHAGHHHPGYGGYAQGGYGGYGQGGYGGADVSGSAYYPGYNSPTGIPYYGGVNMNIITNSGNGQGNTIQTGNRLGGSGLNMNIITNSGNGVGNFINAQNR